MRDIKRLCCSGLIVLVMIGIFTGGYYLYHMKNRPWYEKYNLIAHAMGGIDGLNYTCSLEAFDLNYENGFRVFEVDFKQTSDGVLVGRHSWNSEYDSYSKENVPTAEEFLNNPTFGKYTALSYADILKLAKEYPDIYIITDTKVTSVEDNEAMMSYMSEVAEDLGLTEVLQKQFIIQIYNTEMYDIVKNHINPQNFIFTFYKLKQEQFTDAEIFCVENNIPIITIRKKFWDAQMQEDLEKLGLACAVHTVNDSETAITYLYQGVACIYSDFLSPGIINLGAGLATKSNVVLVLILVSMFIIIIPVIIVHSLTSSKYNNQKLKEKAE